MFTGNLIHRAALGLHVLAFAVGAGVLTFAFGKAGALAWVVLWVVDTKAGPGWAWR